MPAGGHLGAEYALAPLNNIKVQLQYPPLCQCPLEPPCNDRLFELADRVLGGGQIEIFRQLLAYRASAQLEFARFEVLFKGLLDRFLVEAVVLPELVVLRNKHGFHQVRRYGPERHPFLLDLDVL